MCEALARKRGDSVKVQNFETDILIIGGGTAGCFSGLTIAEESKYNVIIVDKANITRSGCLAAGVNALNAYIGKGETPESFVDYVREDSEGVIREDLVYSIAKELNQVTNKIEELGLTILKDEEGNYVQRGKRSIKINGENIKPILAHVVRRQDQIQILEHVQITEYLLIEDEVVGAIGFSLRTGDAVVIHAKAVICATGGAAGIYKPNNPGYSRHKMWYSPFNTGAGYAMGIQAGAEMTSFEMRFIALRCKDTLAPTGTIAQGIGAKQVNGRGEEYIHKYGAPSTYMRLYATVKENQAGNGPCYLQTQGIGKEEERELYKAYLNMAPAQTLQWMERNMGPANTNVEIEGTEPYIVGGHTASGYWVDQDRRTTLKGLYAIGDVAGGSPKKYVTGCFAEGKIAALSIIHTIADKEIKKPNNSKLDNIVHEFETYMSNSNSKFSIEEMEETLQKVMDQYAGGISQGYGYSSERLIIASERLDELSVLCKKLQAKNPYELGSIYDLNHRILVSQVLIKHMEARKETRWRCYQENMGYPNRNDEQYKKYVNSIYKEGKIHILVRPLVRRDETYEHHH